MPTLIEIHATNVQAFTSLPLSFLRLFGLVMYWIKSKLAATPRAKARVWSEQQYQFGVEVIPSPTFPSSHYRSLYAYSQCAYSRDQGCYILYRVFNALQLALISALLNCTERSVDQGSLAVTSHSLTCFIPAVAQAHADILRWSGLLRHQPSDPGHDIYLLHR